MKKLGIVLFLSGVFGCGAELPMNSDRPDAGTPDVQMDRDVPNVDDRTAPPPDAQPDQPVPPPDAPPPPEDRPPAMVCRPALAPPRTCAGELCQPNDANPTCAGASACDCAMRDEEMASPVCTPELMPTCRSMTYCRPGLNHCTVNLPEDVHYAPFPYLDANGGQGGLRNTIAESWIRADAPSDGVGFRGSSLHADRGFVQLCSTLPDDLDGIPSTMAGRGYCAECSGATCYWNRGALRDRAPSIEITLTANACTLEVRHYLMGNPSPARVRTFNSLSRLCNPTK